LQFHIHKKDSAPLGSGEPRGYAPLHEARPLDEFDDELAESLQHEEEVEPGWRSSRRIPIILFCGAIFLFLGIGYVAKQFQSGENLQGVVVEGNGSLLTSEILSLASIDTKQKFYDIDLKQVEQRIEKHGLIHNAVLRRETHPNRIVIHIEEREPIAMIRSQSGEPILVDREYRFFLPKRLSGLKNPDKLLSVPLLGGITERDTAAIIQMAKMVQMIRTTNDGALKDAIGELRRTTTGDFVIYTAATLTPIFIGSPGDERFQTTLEADAVKASGNDKRESLFSHQVELLASFWQKKLKEDLAKNPALYIDARFDGEIILKKRGAYQPHVATVADSAKAKTIAATIH
jgi:cell division septal protein FtsQ